MREKEGKVMEEKLGKRTMERLGRGILVATVSLGAFLWLGSVQGDHAKVAAAKASSIQQAAPAQAATPLASADRDTCDLQLD
jgi:hypothetical protein